MLLYAVVQFFSGTAGVLAKHCVFILAVLVPPITVFFVEDTLTHLALSLGDPERRRPLQSLWDWANRLAIPIPLAILVVCAAVWYMGIGRRRSESPLGRVAQQVRTVVPYLTVAVVAAALVRSIVALRYTSPAAHIGPGEAWLWLALLTVALQVQSCGFVISKRRGSPFQQLCKP
jgi:hypothetical protein